MTFERSIQVLLKRLESSDAFQEVNRRCNNSIAGSVEIGGFAGSLFAVLLATLYSENPRHSLIVAESSDSAAELFDDLVTLVSRDDIYRFELGKHSGTDNPDAENHIGQIETLEALSRRKELIIITSPRGLETCLPPPATVKNNVFSVTAGSEYDYETFTGLLGELGFEKKPFVEAYGDYSVRGGIIDIFPFTGHHPVRMDFDGNRVDSIREFEVMSQRSVKQLEQVRITPNIINGEGEKTHNIFQHLNENAWIIWEDRELIFNEALKHGFITDIKPLNRQIESFKQVNHRFLLGGDRGLARSQPSFQGSVELLCRDLAEKTVNGYDLYVTADSSEEAERIRELIDEATDSTVESGSATDSGIPGVIYIPETLQRGFVLPGEKIACYTEHEVFGRLKRRGIRRRKRFKGFSLHEMHSLKRGDYVVHIDHGIGRFDGLHKLTIGGNEQEGVRIKYAEKDALYVNLNAIHRIQKYSSKEGHVPVINRLGSVEWDKIKARTKKRVKDIARELILLYAKRKSSRGYAFSSDTHWQKELEASFIYDDTPDQASATEAVKADMELPIPMDRLICGDVGFGKTEVAVRAAFKAVMDKKQVAVLVPTTILAEQHFHTFNDRLSRYSIKIDVLSRFRSAAEQKKIIARLKQGSTGIVIGTHRLLSKDVEFSDLGLLVVDEEHRFGVKAKEKIRNMRTNVDTLTLTATPIPRTLHFSLMGARDLSIINTPPKNRLPIMTEIASFAKKTLSEAILQELERGGQAYIVHDRVSDIEDMAGKIRELVPIARVRVAHGQMKPHDLEKTMVDFLEQRFNVLISTKIIESGIDIPNVNTILVTRADRFGLAELYQLRGRVGRSNIQAYAYFLIPPSSAMTRQALRRLQAIEEFTELGSGFNLSMRDLEIRGAGNMLGAEQSGFIEEVGFDMYQKLVDEAVRELKVEEFSDLFPDEREKKNIPREQAVVNVSTNAYLPDTYISFDPERLELYRRLYSMTDEKQVDEISAELNDRFGKLTVEAEALLNVIRLRIRATGLGFIKVDAGKKRLMFEFPDKGLREYYESDLFNGIITRVPMIKNVRARVHEIDKSLKLIVHIEEGGNSVSPLDTALDIIEDLRK